MIDAGQRNRRQYGLAVQTIPVCFSARMRKRGCCRWLAAKVLIAPYVAVD
jgi:hypothetical protein